MKICGVVAEKDVFGEFRLRTPGGVIYAEFKKKECPLGVFYEFEPPLKLDGDKDYGFQAKGKEGVRSGEEVSVAILFEPESAEEAEILLRQNSCLPLCLIPGGLLQER